MEFVGFFSLEASGLCFFLFYFLIKLKTFENLFTIRIHLLKIHASLLLN